MRKSPNGTPGRLGSPPPPDDPKYRVGKFAGLDSDGLPRVGFSLPGGSIMVNKEMPVNTSDHTANVDLPDGGYKSAPLSFRAPEPGVVDRVLLTSTSTDHLLIKVLMRHTRRPELGDKFSSRHGQKGVVGLIAAQENMPFNDQGIVPDMIMNPHGFPSRMTVGKVRRAREFSPAH